MTIALIGAITASLGRIVGNLDSWGYYLGATVFLVVGLYLLDVLPSPWSVPAIVPIRGK